MSDPSARQIYLLNPRDLSPETIAVTFAKTSRSPQSFREIADELTDARSAEFHEKWVVGYGHASVAEHAVVHLACENISRLAVECLESNRLASYTEKSTRYQTWDAASYYVPTEVRGTLHEEEYRRICDRLFAAYQQALGPVREAVRRQFPPQADESESRWDARVRSRYVDVCRFLLPSAALANVGMTVNARGLEHALRKMLANPLDEVRAIGTEMRATAGIELPTLLKYAEPSPFLVRQSTQAWRVEPGSESPDGEWLTLVAWDPKAEERVLAAQRYSLGGGSFVECAEAVGRLTDGEMREMAGDLLRGMAEHDIPPRHLEHAWYTFDALMDQGAYFEVKRHRMMTQTVQPLTAHLGFATPRLMVEAGLEPAYTEAMTGAQEVWRRLAAWNPAVASYVVPNGFRRRLLMTFNLREAYHFCRLRSSANAHFSVRVLALRMAEAIARVHPLFGATMALPTQDTWQSVLEDHFSVH
jgi:thymidylate synthase ThyX